MCRCAGGRALTTVWASARPAAADGHLVPALSGGVGTADGRGGRPSRGSAVGCDAVGRSGPRLLSRVSPSVLFSEL